MIFSTLALRIGGSVGAMLAGATSAVQAGPCTTQIAQLEQQIAVSPPGPESGPTGLQSVGAQLHEQPTPGSVQQAERTASADADAALDRARKADAANNAAGCTDALHDARRLYGLE